MNDNKIKIFITTIIAGILVVIICAYIIVGTPSKSGNEIPIRPPIPKPKISSYTLKGGGYGYKDWPLPLGNPFSIDFRLKTTSSNGVIFSYGDTGPPQPGICDGTINHPCSSICIIMMLQGSLVVLYNTPSGKILMKSDPTKTILINGYWHRISIARQGSSFSLAIDDELISIRALPVDPGIIPNKIFIGHTNIIFPDEQPSTFIGCIDKFTIDDKYIIGDLELTGDIFEGCE